MKRLITAKCWGRFPPADRLAGLRRGPWDCLVVGAGHNGLACAAYLARAGKRVLVVEARERVGGACTLEETWPGVRASPCAYLCGLLHPKVIDELGLPARGFRWTPAEAGMFVPFDDGESIQLWDDPDRCRAEVARIAPGDVAGWERMQAVKRRLRDALRPANDDDLWLDPFPRREEIDRRLGSDEEARRLGFEWSMADFLAAYLSSERLRAALLGQGVIGTNASPFDPGTASIHFHHASGRMEGQPGAWGFVTGGIGMVSFLICDAALEAGAEVVTGLPVARIEPGAGIELAGGDRLSAPVIVSNADPRTTLGLVGDRAPAAWRQAVEAVPCTGCTLKANLLMSELPDFRARPGTDQPHHYGQVNTPLTAEQWRSSFQTARRGELPARLWTELYFQTARDRTLAPPNLHLVSVFAQYVPYAFASGTWDGRRDDVRRALVDTLGAFCSNVPDAVVDVRLLGPPDIEREVGLSGGHIFHGECLPPFMWDRRLSCRTPLDGLYLCGAGTHPGGSVIGVNGRNAAMAICARHGGSMA